MVLFNPPETVTAAIARLYTQVKWLIIVDNGRNHALKAQVAAAKCHWIENPENNLAKAQNLGIARAKELGAAVVLLMDDDSEPAADMVTRLRAAWQPGMGVVGPYLEEPAFKREPHYIQACGKFGFRRVTFHHENLLSDLFYVAASGSLIPLEVIDNIGGMDEGLGIYFVDTEFCLRARAAGYNIAAVGDARLVHRFGKRSEHILLGRKISTTNHPAAAREKMFRNRKKLWQKYGKNYPGYVVFDVLRAASEMLRVNLFEAEKLEKIRAMLRGLIH